MVSKEKAKSMDKAAGQKKIKVYIAGPYTKGDPFENTKKAIELGQRLLDAGYCPFVPHLTHFWHTMIQENPWEVWMDLDLQWLPTCDVVFRMEGESKGADIEVSEANRLGVPVVYSWEQLEESKEWISEPKVPKIEGSPEFRELLKEIWQQHLSKGKDYGTDEDPLDNVHQVAELGIEPWVYAFCCATEAMRRVRNHLKGRKQLSGASLSNALKDAASWALLSEVERRANDRTD